jgi:mycothiol synthase
MPKISEADHQSTSLISRPYAGEADLLQMLDLLKEARSQTNDWRYPHVGDLLFWYFMVVCHLNPQEHIRLWLHGSRLVGYVILGEDPSFDCQVLPGYAWKGIENDMIAWAETRLAELRKIDAARWGGKLVSGSRQDDAQRIAFLEQHGFQPGGEFSEVNMLCMLEKQIPTAVVPAGYQVRAVAAAGEISNRAAAQRAVWSPWTVGDVSDENYADLMRLPGYERELDVVAVAPDSTIAAYVNGWIDPLNRIGDFGPLGALPAYRRLGLTRAVLCECLRRMQARGMQRVSVSTGVSNIAAQRLYESVGFKIVNQYLEYLKAA